MEGLNNVCLGDCLEVMKEIPDKSIDMILTDPPYLINYKTNHRKNKKHEFCTPIIGDTDNLLVSNYIKECYRVMKK